MNSEIVTQRKQITALKQLMDKNEIDALYFMNIHKRDLILGEFVNNRIENGYHDFTQAMIL